MPGSCEPAKSWMRVYVFLSAFFSVVFFLFWVSGLQSGDEPFHHVHGIFTQITLRELA